MDWHVTMRLSEDHGIARTPAALRCASGLLIRRGESRGLVCHRIADTHAHVLLHCDRQTAGQFARASETALQHALHLDTAAVAEFANISARTVHRLRAIPIREDRARGFALQLRWRTLRANQSVVTEGWSDASW